MERQKVIFPQLNDKGEIEQETMWCIKNDIGYIVDNIPFIAKRISLGDIIKAEYDKLEAAYYFEDFISISGNTTLRIYFHEVELIEKTRRHLNSLGCESEVFLGKNFIAVNVPKDTGYKFVKEYLDKGEAEGNWTYEESCLAHKY